jgi:hypothetical protein
VPEGEAKLLEEAPTHMDEYTIAELVGVVAIGGRVEWRGLVCMRHCRHPLAQ